MAKGKRIEGAKTRSLTIRFDRQEDVELFNRLVVEADSDFRRPVEQFVLKQLHDLFPEIISAQGLVGGIDPFYQPIPIETNEKVTKNAK